jgi:tetratricopeptide (TPR) repeat protein
MAVPLAAAPEAVAAPDTAAVVPEEEPAPPLEFLDVGAPLDGGSDTSVVELEPLVEEPSFVDPGVAAPEGVLLSDIELNALESSEVETVEPLDGLERVDADTRELLAHEGIELLLEPAFDDAPAMESRALDGLELVATDLEVRGLEGRADEPPPSDDAEVQVEFPGDPSAFEDPAPADLPEVAAYGAVDDLSLDDVTDGAPEADVTVVEGAPAGHEEFSVAEFPEAAVVDAPYDVAESASGPSDFGVVAGEPWQPTGAPRSVEELEERVLENPDDPETHRELGEALLFQGETGRAVDEFELALSGYEAGGEQERAETLLALLITLQPDDVRFYQRRVEYAYRTGDREHLLGAYLDLADVLARVQAEDKAIAVYWRVLEHEPDNARAQLALQLLGVLDLDTAESAPALEAPDDAIAEVPSAAEPEELPESDLVLAEAGAPELTEMDEAPTSVETAEPAPEPEGAERRPLPSPDEFIDLGALVIEEAARPRDTRMTGSQVEPTGDEQRDFEEMLSQFKKGIDENVDLDDYQAHYDLGVAFKEMGLLDEAVAEFQRALRAPEGRLRTSEALGICFFEKGQFAVAEAVLRRAVDTLPGGDDDKIGLIYWLARAAEEQGRADVARALYERALAVDIRFQDTNDRINRLMTGRQ